MPINPLWYKDAVIYEVHVRSFHDSVGDGVGDFRGLTAKLDYIEDLGVTAIWVLPFYPSPLKDDGYDIADYTSVNPTYGTLDDFQAFLDEAHRRGLRVITELVINHTSAQHPWFQRARRAPAGSPEREFYVWSDTPDRYANVPLMFPDFETSNWTWDPVAKAYYWHRFYSHQPDLNYDSPAVWDAILPVMDFWFGLGVDGMRLDAVPYLYEREGTNCEHLPETHAFLKALRKRVDERFPGRMLLAEANAWPEEAVRYFGDGDECHMAFHFPLMPRLFMALQQEARFPVMDMYAQTPAIPPTAQWCLFLRNHDEMTLAMVTDEERDSMYRAYARDSRARLFLGIRHRLAPLLQNDRRRIELMNALLFSLPGSPVVYYGDEIGMGDNIYLGDRDGVRTPMQWSADRNAGFSRANPQRLFLPIIIDPEYHYEAVNVESQQNNPSSLLWWTKRLISLRKRHPTFGRGDLAFIDGDNPKVLAFVRQDDDARILVIANLSRYAQHASLDLRDFRGVAPEELFGGCRLPAVGDGPYPVTLGPHGYYWFLMPQAAVPADIGGAAVPEIAVAGNRLDLSAGTLREDLEEVLAARFRRNPAGGTTGVRIEGGSVVRFGDLEVLLLMLRVEYPSDLPERALFPVARVAAALLVGGGEFVLARVAGHAGDVLCDAVALPEYARNLLDFIRTSRSSGVPGGTLSATAFVAFPTDAPIDAPPVVGRGSGNSVSVRYGSEYMLKLFRRIDDEPNPDLEVSRFLAGGRFPHAPAVIGHLDFRRRAAPPITLAVLRPFVPNQGTAWQHALDHISAAFERLAALSRESPPSPPAAVPLIGSTTGTRGELGEQFDGYIEAARLIGRRTGELHAALSSDPTDPRFAPEPFDAGYQRSVYQSMRSLAAAVLDRLRDLRSVLPESAQPLADQLSSSRAKLIAAFSRVRDRDLRSRRIRCHGDFQLDLLLYTGNDFLVKDFEGDPRMSGGERRIKRSPLRDAASMLVSWRYVCYSTLYGLAHRHGRPPGQVRPEDNAALAPWVAGMVNWVSREYLNSYAETPGVAELLPASPEGVLTLLRLLTLDRLLLELDHDLTNRPAWAGIPLAAALELVGQFD